MELQEELEGGSQEQLGKRNWDDFVGDHWWEIVLGLTWMLFQFIVIIFISFLILLIELNPLLIILKILGWLPVPLLILLLISITISDKGLKPLDSFNDLNQGILQKTMKMIPNTILGTSKAITFLSLHNPLQILNKPPLSLRQPFPTPFQQFPFLYGTIL